MISFGHQELYKIFVQAHKDANTVALEYPDKEVELAPTKRRVLYFISGWILSRILTRVKRHSFMSAKWLDVVNTNVFHSSERAVEFEPELSDLVGEVDSRNDTVNGRGLLYPRMRFFDFVLTLESGYFHILKSPAALGAYLGDLPNEINKVVRESLPVQKAWEKCCPPTLEPSAETAVLSDIFDFIMTKWHNVRMGDYTRRLSEVSSTVSAAKADNTALRTTLKVVSRNSKGSGAGSRSSGERGRGVPSEIAPESVSESAPESVSSARQTGDNVSDAHKNYRGLVSGMTEVQFQNMTKDELIYHARLAGGKFNARMTKSCLIWELRCIAPFIALLEEETGGLTTNAVDGSTDNGHLFFPVRNDAGRTSSGTVRGEENLTDNEDEDLIDVGLQERADVDDTNFARYTGQYLSTCAEMYSEPDRISTAN